MNVRVIRGVRIVTTEGMRAASIHIADGTIVAIAGYDDIPRECVPDELGKGVLMPGLVQHATSGCIDDGGRAAARGGITTLLVEERPTMPMLVHVATTSHATAQTMTATTTIDLSTLLATTWTAMRNRGEAIESIVEKLCTAPAHKAGLHSKGSLEVGMDADFAIWHPEYTVIDSKPLLYGLLRHTIVKGNTVYRDGVFTQT